MKALRRQRALADYTLAALARRKVKNLALVGVFSLVVFLLASAMFFASALRHEASAALEGVPDLIVQHLSLGRQGMISEDRIAELESIRGVSKVRGRLWGYYYDRVSGANYTVMVPDGGQMPAPGQVIVGEGIPRARGLDWEGAPLFLSRKQGDLNRFDIAQIYSSDSALLTADLLLMNEADFRAFFSVPEGVYTDIAARVRNANELATIIDKATSLMPDERFVSRDDIARTYMKLFDWREGLMVALGAMAMLAFAIFAADKASGLSAEEAREIGILKAIGWDTRDVIAMKLWEGGLVSVGAFLLGAVAAYAHVFWFGAPLFAPVLKGWAVIYPDFALAPVIDGSQLVTLFLLTVLPYAAATVVPVWRAASADPDAVMR
ncbi:FtsX-like permease family protein [Rhodobacter aestuarii]|uniref:FtsX-like permease family protein n=1 Tax=Rhodobacter aestuarii TaxID=453582 RepID=A0A1N7J2A6_9RHOB|nr:FtsX-like permease family protein [Rhodobacter aestuarii]PTV97263.1 FtsX-like permease family protein [Rhodobacter aestuarii]SIS43473.1 FtsX-like permease family protein [Rhodobacter aestuarii]